MDLIGTTQKAVPRIIYGYQKEGVNRLQLTKNQGMLTRPFFNTSLLEPQKPDFSLKKATKVKDHEAPVTKVEKNLAGEIFFI